MLIFLTNFSDNNSDKIWQDIIINFYVVWNSYLCNIIYFSRNGHWTRCGGFKLLTRNQNNYNGGGKLLNREIGFPIKPDRKVRGTSWRKIVNQAWNALPCQLIIKIRLWPYEYRSRLILRIYSSHLSIPFQVSQRFPQRVCNRELLSMNRAGSRSWILANSCRTPLIYNVVTVIARNPESLIARLVSKEKRRKRWRENGAKERFAIPNRSTTRGKFYRF